MTVPDLTVGSSRWLVDSRRSRSRLWRLGGACLAAVLAISAVAAVSSPAASQQGDEAVRIVARKLTSGRVEFGLQLREADDSWGQRQLPRVRFFPPTARVDSWLASSALSLPVGEVRIVARKLEGGRIEFGLQQRQADDSWGERQLPRVRFFPPTARVDRWLVSSPLALAAPLEPLWVILESPAPGAVTGNFAVTIAFAHPVTGFAEGDVRVANGRTVGLSGSGRTYTAEVEPAADGAVVVRVPAGVARDERGRGNEGSAPLTRLRASRGDAVREGLDTWDRAGVLDAYAREFDRTEPEWDFTGNVDDCVAGTTGQEFRDSVFGRLNWYRRMAGLGTVEEDEDSSAGAQQTALMMLAEGSLSHEPDSSWACYSSTGRSFAASNLGLGTSVGGLAGIDGYMQDPGENNAEVGHRRWILYPQTQEMGTGNVRRDRRDAAGNREANALWPRDANIFADRPAVREQRGFVAWPPGGYVPAETVWGRWSFSLGGADFSGASVTMSDDAGPVRVEVIHRSAAPRANSRSAPESAIVWAVDGDTDSNLLPAPSGPDHCYTVTVSGVRIGAATQLPYEYATCLLGEAPTVPADHRPPAEDPEPDDAPTPAVSGAFEAVSAGAVHTCGLRGDGTITCWGSNTDGQSDAPGGRFKAVAAGEDHSCGLRSDNTITCWGASWMGGAPGGRFRSVAVGGWHSCGLRADRTITCWGANDHSQANAPDGRFKAVTAGTVHSCGLRADDTITCWGSNNRGQSDAPAGRFKAVTAGLAHSCGLRADDTITCWGGNPGGTSDAPEEDSSFFRCGLRSDNTIYCWGRADHGQVDAPSGRFKAVDAGDLHSCGLRGDDTITCWGLNKAGESEAPDGIYKSVTAGGIHSCGLRVESTITCWGVNHRGQRSAPVGAFIDVAAAGLQGLSTRGFACGLRSDGTVTCWGDERHSPEPSGYFKAVTAGTGHSCALRVDGTLMCWGSDAGYRDGSITWISEVLPNSLFSFKTIDAGYRYSCGVLSDNTVICWGSDNEFGERDAPSGSFKSLSVGRHHSCGLRTDNTVTCWGYRVPGSNSAPAGTFKSVSVGNHSCGLRTDNTITCWGVSGITVDGKFYGHGEPPSGTFKSVTVGRYHSCGLRTDDTIICWGVELPLVWGPRIDDDYGVTDAPRGTFKSVSAGKEHTCGLRTDDTITCWGVNSYGVTDAPAGRFTAVSAGSQHSCALRADGTIACWGRNSGLQSDAPDSFFKAIGGRGDGTCGIRTDNTIRCWGLGSYTGYSAAVSDPNASGAFSEVTYGNDFGCGLRTDDTILCWGGRVRRGEFGQTIAIYREADNALLDEVLVLPGRFKAVTAGAWHLCGLRANNTITCLLSDSAEPDNRAHGQADVPDGSFRSVSAGNVHTCGLRTDGTVTCWGYNELGQTDAPGGSFKAVSAGNDYTCGLRADNTVTCWGNNKYGQTDAPDGQFEVIKAGRGGNPCGLRNDGTIICWGTLPLRVFAGGGA